MLGVIFTAFFYPILEGLTTVILTGLELAKSTIAIKIAAANLKIQKLAEEPEEKHNAIGFVLPCTNEEEAYEEEDDDTE